MATRARQQPPAQADLDPAARRLAALVLRLEGSLYVPGPGEATDGVHLATEDWDEVVRLAREVAGE